MSYRKEADQQLKIVEEMKIEGKDAQEIDIMNQCAQESLMMIPDSHRRLEKAISELSNILKDLEPMYIGMKTAGEQIPTGYVEIMDAKKALEIAQEQLKEKLP